jgi:hypothetical protein
MTERFINDMPLHWEWWIAMVVVLVAGFRLAIYSK